jgi:hypothetical protein
MRLASLILTLLLAAGCSQTSSANKLSTTSGTTENANPPPGAVPVAGGCGVTQLYTGSVPKWAGDVAGAPAYAVPPGPYAIAKPPIAVAFMPLPLLSDRARLAQGRGNKVFWAVKTVRLGEVVTIDGHPADSPSPNVHYDLDAPTSLTGPGAWLGSGLNAPTPGCWHFVLRWPDHQTEMDLKYVS